MVVQVNKIMEKFIKNMIEEHETLYKRINKLREFIAKLEKQEIHMDVSMHEYGLLNAQLASMEIYLHTLGERLNIHGIIIRYDGYYEKVNENNNHYED